jgi:hypothetical protein
VTLTQEERLELEQAGLSPDTIQHMMQDTVTVDTLQRAIREVQEVIGPHGSTSRLQAGGVRITREGMSVFEDGVQKTSIDFIGNLFVGSDITSPANTTLAVFVSDQTYNAEEMGAGDLLIGNNSDGFANIKYNAGDGRLQFRIGQTINIYLDADSGNLVIANNADALNFEDSSGFGGNAFIVMDSSDNLGIENFIGNVALVTLDGEIQLFTRLTNGTDRAVVWKEDAGNANVTQLNASLGAAGGKMSIDNSVIIWAAKDGTETVFNEDSFDIDFRVESAANANAVKLDAGAETLSLFDVIIDGGAEHRLEIGADHYFPTRNSSNTTGYWNEANQDMDFIFEGDTDEELLWIDAGLDGIGIGGAAQSGYKLKVTGNVSIEGAVVINESGSATSDVRIEGDTTTHLFFLDASDDKIGINTSLPLTTLHVEGSFLASDTATYLGTVTYNGAVVMNENGADFDVRIEGDTNTNLFFTDASTDRIGIGTSTPGATLDVRGSVIINEAGGDNDTRIEGDNDANLFFIDASLDRIGIGTAAPGVKLDIDNGTVRSKLLATLADDTATSFTPSTTVGGMIVMASTGAGNGGFAGYNTVTGTATAMMSGTNFAAANGTLAGTTGTDTKLTVAAHSDGKIYVENRTGATRNILILLM